MRVVTETERNHALFLKSIVSELADQHGIAASVEYPGYIQIEDGNATETGRVWAFGSNNETWTGDLMTDDGAEVCGHADTGIPVSDDTNEPALIALAIANAIRDFKEGPAEDETPEDHFDAEESAREDYEREDR